MFSVNQKEGFFGFFFFTFMEGVSSFRTEHLCIPVSKMAPCICLVFFFVLLTSRDDWWLFLFRIVIYKHLCIYRHLEKKESTPSRPYGGVLLVNVHEQRNNLRWQRIAICIHFFFLQKVNQHSETRWGKKNKWRWTTFSMDNLK